jgi:hypothetical protein
MHLTELLLDIYEHIKVIIYVIKSDQSSQTRFDFQTLKQQQGKKWGIRGSKLQVEIINRK